MAPAHADGVQHGKNRRSFGAAAGAGVRDEPGAFLRQAGRKIAYEQALAEPRHRLDVVLARSGREVPDRVGMRTGRVALLGALYFFGRGS